MPYTILLPNTFFLILLKLITASSVGFCKKQNWHPYTCPTNKNEITNPKIA